MKLLKNGTEHPQILYRKFSGIHDRIPENPKRISNDYRKAFPPDHHFTVTFTFFAYPFLAYT